MKKNLKISLFIILGLAVLVALLHGSIEQKYMDLKCGHGSSPGIKDNSGCRYK